MYHGTFERADLAGVITNDDLGKLETRLQQQGEPTPTPMAISRAVATFNRYAAKYLVDDDLAKRLIGAVAVYYLYERLGAVPPLRQKVYDDAMTEMRAIRDGKFPDMALDGVVAPTVSSPAPGRYGSQRRFETQ